MFSRQWSGRSRKLLKLDANLFCLRLLGLFIDFLQFIRYRVWNSFTMLGECVRLGSQFTLNQGPLLVAAFWTLKIASHSIKLCWVILIKISIESADRNLNISCWVRQIKLVFQGLYGGRIGHYTDAWVDACRRRHTKYVTFRCYIVIEITTAFDWVCDVCF